jgi:hypothetical protein
MGDYTLNISTIQDLQNLSVSGGNTALYGISNALSNANGDATPTNYWYPVATPSNSLYTVSFQTGSVNPTNYRVWARGNAPNDSSYLPSTMRLTVTGISTFVDQNPVWLSYTIPGTGQYGYVYENAVGPGNFSNVSEFQLSYNYYDNGTADPTTYGVRLLNLKITGESYIPPIPPGPIYPKEVLPTTCGCGPKPTGPGAISEGIYLTKKMQSCTVVNSKIAQQLVNSQLRGVPSSVRTQQVQQKTLECYAPITDPYRRQALYQGPVVTPPCPPTPAEQLNSTMPKPSNGGNCLQAVPFYQRPAQ